MNFIKRNLFLILIILLIYPAFSLEDTENVLSTKDISYYSLKASGTDENLIPEYSHRLENLKNSYLAEINGISHEEAAEYSLTFLYRDTLSVYNSNQTRLDVLLDSKKYNCVSSSILVLYLLRSAGIQCRIIEATQHAFIEVYISDFETPGKGSWIRMETTNPYGYNPGQKRTEPDSNRYYIVPANNYRNAHAVSDRRGIALIYNNRIADFTNAQKSHIAYPLAKEAYELQRHSPESLEMVQSIASNYISEFVAQKNFEEGLAFAKETKAEFGLSKHGLRNTEALISEIANKLTQEKKYNECMDFLNSSLNLLPVEVINKYKIPAIQNQTYSVFDTEGYDTALAFLQSQNALSNKQMNQILISLRQNEAANIHNSIVPLVNSKQYEEAAKILRAGIEKLGNEKILTTDLKRLEPYLNKN